MGLLDGQFRLYPSGRGEVIALADALEPGADFLQIGFDLLCFAPGEILAKELEFDFIFEFRAAFLDDFSVFLIADAIPFDAEAFLLRRLQLAEPKTIAHPAFISDPALDTIQALDQIVDFRNSNHRLLQRQRAKYASTPNEDGIGTYFWQHNWGSPKGFTHPAAHLHQVEIDKRNVGGIGVDINHVLKPQFGQWD